MRQRDIADAWFKTMRHELVTTKEHGGSNASKKWRRIWHLLTDSHEYYHLSKSILATFIQPKHSMRFYRWMSLSKVSGTGRLPQMGRCHSIRKINPTLFQIGSKKILHSKSKHSNASPLVVYGRTNMITFNVWSNLGAIWRQTVRMFEIRNLVRQRGTWVRNDCPFKLDSAAVFSSPSQTSNRYIFWLCRRKGYLCLQFAAPI